MKFNVQLLPFLIASGTMSLSISVSAEDINNGGYIQNVVLNDGDNQNVFGDTQMDGVTINNGGYQQMMASVYDTTINSGGVQNVTAYWEWSHGSAEKTLINEGGVQNVYSNGPLGQLLVYSIDVNIKGGEQNIGRDGIGVNTTIYNGGVQNVSDGGVAEETYIMSDGLQIVQDKSVTTDTTLLGGRSILYAGALANGTTNVNFGGELIMNTGSHATDVLVNGGTIFISDLDDGLTSLTPAQIDKLTMDGGNVSFLRETGSVSDFATLNISELSGTGNFLFNSSLAERNSNFVTIESGTGNFGVAVSDSGYEIMDHDGLTVNLIHDKEGDIDFSMVTAKGRSTGAVDGGTYMYTLHSGQDKDGLDGGNVWYLAGIEKSVDSDELLTTPATDAVLSMATAGLNVMRGELDALRTYRNNQTTERKHGEGNVWGHYLGKKSAVDTSNGAAYKLHQNGFELGGDITTGFDGGNLVTGAFVTLSDNKVNHARGGKSKVDSYGLGAYATWYDNSGFYVDSAVKANRLESSLNAKMTNGNSTSGNWHQYGITTVVEGGFTIKPTESFFVEPFIRTTATHINGANVALTNGMKAETGKARSLTAEAGTRLGTKFSLGKTEFSPYMHLGVEQEFAKSNQTIINGVNRFDNNLNGTAGKYGVGMSAKLADNVALYGEANYRQGSYVEEPVQGVAGIRVGF